MAFSVFRLAAGRASAAGILAHRLAITALARPLMAKSAKKYW
jgi:hypothetical protein